MNTELKKIKKLYGEDMMHFCRDNFALILETSDLLLDILTSNFNPTHELYKDLINQGKLIDFKNLVLKKIAKEEEKIIQADETPKELMVQAGYDLYECLSEEDIQSFRKYYAKGEELCTFGGNRLQKNRVFFAVKKDVDKIKRKDFSKPSRQDLYGTSVISIQFTKDGTNTLSIKNRYNHTVDFPDSTFSNNLDNIIPGLTASFEIFYGIKQRYKNDDLELNGYVRANDGKYYKYNYEINNIYYCPDNIIINNFEVKRYPKEQYVILDYFILDLERKKIELYDPRRQDSFPNSINDIKKIEIRNTNEGKEILITPRKGEVIEIHLDKFNRIISYKNNNVKIVQDNFLYYAKNLENINMNNLECIGTDFLHENLSLKEINFPKVRFIGQFFLYYNKILKSLNMPNLYQVDDYFLYSNENLKVLCLPKLEEARDYFLTCNGAIELLNMPNLYIVGNGFLELSNELKELFLPNLTIVGNNFLGYNIYGLKEVCLPKLEEVGNYFLAYSKSLERVDLPNLESAGTEFLKRCSESLKVFIAPKLEVIGELEPLAFYERYPNLQEFIVADMESFPSLKRNLEKGVSK